MSSDIEFTLGRDDRIKENKKDALTSMRVNEQLIAGGRLNAGWGGENARRWRGL